MAPGRARFDTTRWSLIAAAGGDDASVARQAFAALCETYWYPLYAYARRQGYEPEDARDLTQSFFVSLIERNDVPGLRRERGRFRSFLLASIRHFLLNDIASRRRLKRGGGQVHLSLEFEDAESRYTREPADTQTPDKLFDRRWAETVLAQAFAVLEAEATAAGRAEEFNRLQMVVKGEPQPGGYLALATDLGVTEGAIKMAILRLRRRLREVLREVIAETVLTDEAVEDEIRHLFKAFSD